MIGHALQIATKGILGSLSTLGYIIGFTITEAPIIPPTPPPQTPVELPYVGLGGGGYTIQQPLKPAKKKKAITIRFWYKGEMLEQTNLINDDISISMSDLVLIETDSKPLVAMKSFNKV